MAVAQPSDILTALSAQLKINDQTILSPYWTAITTRAALFAQQEVYGRLLARGFRLAEDILPFDRLYEFTLDLGVWKSVMMGGLYANFDATALAALDRRAELAEVFVFVNGVWVQPALGEPGVVNSGGGPLAPDPTSVFTFDATDRSNYGIDW